MKKVVSLIVTIIITLLLVLTSYAVNVNTYQIDELGMSIDVPAEYIVFTRSVESDDPNLETYGLTQNDVLNAMEKGNIYLSILDKDNNFEIAITMTENGLEDLNQFDDTSIDTMVSLLKEEYEKLGVIVDGYDVYQHSQAKFIKIYQTNKEGTICGLQYYTIYANKAINITLKSYSDKINSSEESTMKEIIDSVHFGMEFTLTGKTVEREIETTESFVYKDDETGVEFTVPENWIETSLYKEGEYMDAKFQSNIEKTIIILYGSTNLWENLSEAERSAISKVDIDNLFFTVSDVAELMEVSQSMVSKENYGGKDYFIIERTQTTSMYGMDISANMTEIMRFEDGYKYSFLFLGTRESEYYKDFESLLKSVKYPNISEKTVADEGTLSTFNELPFNGQSPLSPVGAYSNRTNGLDLGKRLENFFLSLLFTVVIYSLPITIYRYAIRKKPFGKVKAIIITIIYGIMALSVTVILMSIISISATFAGRAALLWGIINYKMLSTD